MRALLLASLLSITALLHAQARPAPHAQAQGDDVATERVQLFGSVTDSLTGKPVYACMVEHYDGKGKRWSVTVVNSDGNYALFIPVGVAYELRITNEDGYLDFRRSFPPLPKGTKSFRADLRLKPL